MTDCLAYALYYARLAWQVFPVHTIVDVDQCSCGNSGCDAKGKHPRTPHGLKDATDDEAQIRAWWAEFPDANIGIATGSASGIWVLDPDLRDGGRANWERFRAGRACETVEQMTGSGGAHLIFRWQGDLEVRNRTNVLPGVDVRGDGGYIIVPPSRHISGGTYQWIESRDPSAREPLLAPTWLLELVLGEAGPEQRAPAPAIFLGTLPPQEIRAIRSALASISADCDRDKWIRIGMALHSTGAGAQAFAVWDEWSSTASATRPNGKPLYPGTQALARQWASFHPKQTEARLGTLFHYAIESGWDGKFEELADGRVLAMMPEAVAPRAVSFTAWSEPEWIWGRKDQLAFPIDDAFPERVWWWREWCKALAHIFQVPVDFPAAMSLAMASGAVAGKYQTHIPGYEWTEEAPIWVVCAMPSGMRKSVVFSPLIRPFRDFEDALDETRQEAMWKGELSVAEVLLGAAKKDLERKGAALLDDPVNRQLLVERSQQAELARDNILLNKPQSDRLLVSDATTEALVEFLQEHHGRALVADPEGGVFDHALGSKDRTGRIDAWLKAWGAETIDERRIGQPGMPKRGRYVKRPLAAVAVATQNGALANLFSNGNADARGFLARFLTVVLPPNLPDEFLRAGLLPSELVAAWASAVKSVLAQPMPSEPILVPVSIEARTLFDAWGSGSLNRARTSEDERTDYLTSWNSKLAGKCLRIALTLHVLAGGGPAIDADTMRAALAWLPYLQRHHALLAKELRTDPDTIVAERILNWLAAHQCAEVTRRDLHRALAGSRAAVRTVDDLNGALAVLTDSGWLRPIGKVEPRRFGPPAAKRYEVYPTLPDMLRTLRAKFYD